MNEFVALAEKTTFISLYSEVFRPLVSMGKNKNAKEPSPPSFIGSAVCFFIYIFSPVRFLSVICWLAPRLSDLHYKSALRSAVLTDGELENKLFLGTDVDRCFHHSLLCQRLPGVFF